ARRVAYGEAALASGPTYRSHVVRGDTVVVNFENVGGGLISGTGEDRVAGFEVAGADHRFVWADARIVGSRVEVRSDRVMHPVSVRYAWANNPGRANLYNREKLPAVPFRTDRW
ncbi:MAG TPA: hypothetical protein VFJ20_01325, partial [Gemmatimonadaceae bacterium]|nr:hypothetical protein [Gemmatimonadaceae bacterium]